MNDDSALTSIRHSVLLDWLNDLALQTTLLAPTTTAEHSRFGRVSKAAEIDFSIRLTDLPPKEHFLPATHTLFTVVQDGNGPRIVEPAPLEERVLFGVRPCDARALAVLDALFINEDPVDPYYAESRRQTTIVGIACKEMSDSCFCTSVGIAPDHSDDVDLMLTAVDDGFVVQEVTDKGKQLAAGLSREPFRGTLPRPTISARLPVPPPDAWPAFFSDSLWMRTADRCLSCRACTYVCPTCRCFDVRDYQSSNGSIERLRAWDSCLSEGYRRIAGGHNPRPTKTERLRNRIYCKFCYYPQDFGPVACVGCGRCINTCPANVDIAELLETTASL